MNVVENFIVLFLKLNRKKIKGRGHIRSQIGPLTFLKIFVLEMRYIGRFQHSEPSYIIGLDHFHVSIFLIIRE